jgi:hypothetical protein
MFPFVRQCRVSCIRFSPRRPAFDASNCPIFAHIAHTSTHPSAPVAALQPVVVVVKPLNAGKMRVFSIGPSSQGYTPLPY